MGKGQRVKGTGQRVKVKEADTRGKEGEQSEGRIAKEQEQCS